MSGYLSVSEAAVLIGASTSTIQKRCKDGTIPAIRVGKHYKVLRSDLEKWVTYTPQPEQTSRRFGRQDAGTICPMGNRGPGSQASKPPTTRRSSLRNLTFSPETGTPKR